MLIFQINLVFLYLIYTKKNQLNLFLNKGIKEFSLIKRPFG